MARDTKNYNYYHSEILNQDFAHHKINGFIIFPDKVKYDKNELKLLKDIVPEILPGIHLLKKVFRGIIVG